MTSHDGFKLDTCNTNDSGYTDSTNGTNGTNSNSTSSDYTQNTTDTSVTSTDSQPRVNQPTNETTIEQNNTNDVNNGETSRTDGLNYTYSDGSVIDDDSGLTNPFPPLRFDEYWDEDYDTWEPFQNMGGGVRGTRLVVQLLCDFRLVGRGPL